jgi:hypothetical protein
MSRGRNSVRRLVASRTPKRVTPGRLSPPRAKPVGGRASAPLRARIRATPGAHPRDDGRFDPGMTGTDHFLLFGL